MRTLTRRFTLLLLAALGVAACSDSTSPPDDGGGTDGGVTTIEVAPASPTVEVGHTVTLGAVAKDASGNTVTGTTFTWASASPAVASVDQATGVVTGVAEGTASISATGGGKTGSTTVTVTAQTVTASAALAYAREGEIRLVDADGSNDRAIWTTPRPELGYTVSGLAWKPDGTEIAFSSDHEAAVSFFDRDIYTVRPDGSGLRKITNAPVHDQLASYPQGTVTVTVHNLTADGGPYFIYVLGAQEPQTAVIAPGDSKTLTFTNVADLGDDPQPAVAFIGSTRWFDAAVAADVQAGTTVNAGSLTITASGALPHFGAVGPGWRSDGAKLAFLEAYTCILQQIPASPPLGAYFDPLLDPAVFAPCAYDWAPTSVGVNQLLVAQTDFDAGEGGIFRVTEGSSSKGQPLVTYADYDQLTDLRWLPDGSGFLFAKTVDLLDPSVNLFEYVFATGETRQVTTLSGEYVRSFSISPDGQSVAFERAAALDGPADIWVVRRDGSDAHLLVQNGTSPAWNPNPQ